MSDAIEESLQAGGIAGRIKRGFAWSTVSNIVSRCANLVVGIVLARLIAPEAFGVFAIALAVWSVLGSVAEFGLGADLVRRTDYERHIPTVATLGLALSASLGLLMFILAPQIAAAFGSSAAEGVVRLMAIPLALIGLSVVPAALLQRRLAQGTIFAIDGTSLVVSTAATVLLVLVGAGPAALAIGRIAGQAWTVLFQYVAVHRFPRFGWDRTVAREAVGFGVYLALANVVSWLVLTVDNLIVARMMGPISLGLYALAFNIASWPMSVAGQSIRVIALPAFSRLSDPAARGRAMVRTGGLVWSLGLLTAVGVMFLAAQIVGLLYGSRWSGAAVAVVPLAASGALRVIFDLCATYLIACGMTRRVLLVQLVWLLALVPALIAGVGLDGIAGAGWAHLIVAGAVVLPAYLIAMRGAGVGALAFLRGWIVPTLAGIPLAAVLWAISVWVQLPLLAILVGGVVGSLVYAIPLARWWVSRVRSLQSSSASAPAAPYAADLSPLPPAV
ncbi:oligosaccharide flippase family protein [Leifsonia sp. 2MCAF36]|uniref:oligosaccharide flippase family protein n=1 Tax=Leifsonia sp. 2MCAF36 TaxID=3232988 RepID=UPI003F9BABAE